MRGFLISLRAAAVGLLVLLTVNPSLPGRDPASAPVSRGWVLLDGDPALLARDAQGQRLWDQALATLEDRARSGDRLARVQGAAPEGLDREGLLRATPEEIPGDPAEALLRLAEVGADSILLLSPLRRTTARLEEVLGQIPVPVRIERMGGPLRNVALAELEVPARIAAGLPVEGAVWVIGEGGEEGDSVRVELSVGGTVAWESRIPVPDPGGSVRLPFSVSPNAETPDLRLEARVSWGLDGFPEDDVRVRILRRDPPPGGVVLLSLEPDWEIRTLLPVLERATGRAGEGFLALATGEFLPLGTGIEARTALSLEAVLERMGTAALVVLQSGESNLPLPLMERVESHPRVIHLPRGRAGAALAGLETGNPLAGEWRVQGELPPSPLSPYLAGRALDRLPPLRGVLPPARVDVGESALRVGLGGGESLDAVVLLETEAGRRVVALASDFWRWGVREGEPRDVYRNLWAGAVAWLFAFERGSGPGIRTEERVLPRGRPLRWEAPEHGGEGVWVEVRLQEADPEGPFLRRDSVQVDAGGRFQLPPLPPGRYQWRGQAETGSVETGMFEVEAFLDALLRPADDPERLNALAQATGSGRPRPGPGRPLRTHPLPWLLLCTLLCTEWILRRRVGLP